MKTIAFVIWCIGWPVANRICSLLEKKMGIVYSDAAVAAWAVWQYLLWVAIAAMIWTS